jgi:hypothetical protein
VALARAIVGNLTTCGCVVLVFPESPHFLSPPLCTNQGMALTSSLPDERQAKRLPRERLQCRAKMDHCHCVHRLLHATAARALLAPRKARFCWVSSKDG